MKHKNIPLNLIDVPEDRVTAVYDEELLGQLSASLAELGQLNPIIVTENGERYRLVDGLHRLDDARMKGEKTIPAVIYEGGETQTTILNLVTNRLRGKVKASEMVRSIDRLIHVDRLTSDEIAQKTGFGRDYIEQLWAISETWEGIKEALDREAIGVGVAFQLARLPGPLVQEQVLAVVLQFGWPMKQVKEQVDRVFQESEKMKDEPPPPPPKPAEPPPEPHCELCHVTPGPRMLSQIVLCPGCFGAAHARGQELQALAVSAIGDHGDP